LSYAPDTGIIHRKPALCDIHSRQLFDCSIARDHASPLFGSASLGANDAAAICAMSRSLGG